MSKTTKKTYEAMFLLPAGASAELDNSLGMVRSIIERHQGEILVLKKWDERKLAYEIHRQKRGLYVIAYFNAPGDAVAAIERDVNLSENILRVMVLKADHLSREEMEAVEPQPVQEQRPMDRGFERGFERDERSERRPSRRRDEEPAARD